MSDLYKNEFTQHSDIPLSHLDYGYIEKCNDVKELEKILKILRYLLFKYKLSNYWFLSSSLVAEYQKEA